jgi:hypothetical protein
MVKQSIAIEPSNSDDKYFLLISSVFLGIIIYIDFWAKHGLAVLQASFNMLYHFSC